MPEPKRVLLIIETSKAYGRELLEGIGRYAMAHGRWSLYVEERALHDPQPDWLARWKGDGIIFRSYTKAMVDAIKRCKVPTVETHSQIIGHGFPLVYADEEAITRIAVEHFLQRQFQNFGYCSLTEDRWVRWRREAYIKHLDKRGASCHLMSAQGDERGSGWNQQLRKMAAWVRRLPKPVAVLAANDVCGMRLIDACRLANVAIPEQVAVLGVDNDVVLDALTSPPMSSIDPNAARIGYEAAVLLDSMMHGVAQPQKPIFIEPAGVVARQSTDVTATVDTELATALTYIRHNAMRGLVVEDILAYLSISRATLERRFAQLLGRTPKEEIVRVQIEQVKRLLTLTDESLTDIADHTGFKTCSHLSVAFKRNVGMPPTEFRERYQAGNIKGRKREH
jgi:LacI family transcriptional regulator